MPELLKPPRDRLQVFLARSLHERMRALAHERDISFTAVFTEAVEQYLENQEEDSK